MRSLTKTIAAASFIVAFLGASAASADVLLAKSTTGSFAIPDGAPVNLPLDNKDNTVLNFTTTKKGIVVITFNAECAAKGSAGHWVGLQILVDGKPTNPKASQDDFAFCSATNASSYVYSAVSRQAYINLKPGPHSVEVLVSKQGATDGRIDDGSIVIVD